MTPTNPTRKPREHAVVSRPVKVFAFAQGVKRVLAAGSPVEIIDRPANGTLVVLTDDGYTAHVSRADALAFSPAPAPQAPERSLEKEVWSQLRTVFDPEIPVSIVDLGLVYELRIENGNVAIKMTLTAPGCPVGDDIKREIETKLFRLEGVHGVSVDFVWEPPWDREKMSDAAKLQLGIL